MIIMQCNVYIICQQEPETASGPVKIGIASNVEARLRQIKTSTPFPIHVFAVFPMPDRVIARQIEQIFHKSHAYYKAHGEWFNTTPEKAFNAMCIVVMASILANTNLKKERFLEAAKIMGVPDWFIEPRRAEFLQ